ncbi:MAG: cobalamin-dependent protein, partial [Myxococcaceae bacterium]|nr:cobalamin-dependent protein [Myxococcaceae bacterium]
MTTTLLLSSCYPAKAAMAVLAGTVDECPDLSAVQVRLPRDTEQLCDDFRAALAAGNRLIVAFSFYSPSFPDAVAQLNALKAISSTGWVSIAGGVHATAETAQTLEAGFDFVCVGEGERAIIDLLLRAERGLPLEGASGFAWRGGRGPKPPPVELDEFPPFSVKSRLYSAIEITRGCIYACRFCQTPYMSKARFRHRSVENVRRWVRAL